MGVKTNHTAKTVDGSNARRQGVPKTLVEIDKHFKLWSSTSRSKLNLKSKFIQPITYEGAYTKHALRKLQEFGKIIQRKVHK